MKRSLLILLLACGCQSQREGPVTAGSTRPAPREGSAACQTEQGIGDVSEPDLKTGPESSQSPMYDSSSGGSAALVFSAPGDAGSAFSREARGPSAFLGFQSPVTSYQFTRTEDRQTDWGGNWVNRRAVSVRVERVDR